MPSREVKATCRVVTVGDGDGAGGLGPHGHRPGARVVVIDGERRGVVGVAEPGLVAALRPLADPAGAAQPAGVPGGPGTGQLQPAGRRPGGQVVHGDLADRVPGPGRQQHRPAQPGTVQDGVTGEDRHRVLGDQVAPVLLAGLRRVGDRQPSPRRTGIGEHVQAAIPPRVQAGPGVHALLDGPQVRRGRAGCGQVGQPQVITGRGALGRGDHQPAAVPADRGAVIVRLVPARAEDRRVLGVRGADGMQVDPAVELLFPGGDLARRELAHVVERHPARQPGHRGVPAAGDGAVHVSPGGDVHHPQHRLLVAGGGHLVGQQPSLLVRLPRVQRGQAGRIEGHRVDEHAFRLARPGGQQHPVLLPGQAAHEELPLAAPDRGADIAGFHQLADPGGQPVTRGQRRGLGGPQLVLGRQPVLGLLAGGVLQPPVRVGDPVAVQVFDEVKAPGRGVPRHGRRAGGRRVAGCCHARTLGERPRPAARTWAAAERRGTGCLPRRHAGVMSGRGRPVTLSLASAACATWHTVLADRTRQEAACDGYCCST